MRKEPRKTVRDRVKDAKTWAISNRFSVGYGFVLASPVLLLLLYGAFCDKRDASMLGDFFNTAGVLFTGLTLVALLQTLALQQQTVDQLRAERRAADAAELRALIPSVKLSGIVEQSDRFWEFNVTNTGPTILSVKPVARDATCAARVVAGLSGHWMAGSDWTIRLEGKRVTAGSIPHCSMGLFYRAPDGRFLYTVLSISATGSLSIAPYAPIEIDPTWPEEYAFEEFDRLRD
jgi:hypothetical protein